MDDISEKKMRSLAIDQYAMYLHDERRLIYTDVADRLGVSVARVRQRICTDSVTQFKKSFGTHPMMTARLLAYASAIGAGSGD